MLNKVLIATRSNEFFDSVVNAIDCFDRKGFYVKEKVNTVDQLREEVNPLDSFAVICDKYLLGFHMKEICEEIYKKVKGIKIIFAFFEECPKYYAYRIYRNSCDAAIPDLSGDKLNFARRLVSVFDGHFYFTKDVWEGIKNREHLGNEAKYSGEISPRELDIIVKLCEGYRVKEIAVKLNISQSTVSTHILNIRQKIGARSITDIIVKAGRMGMLREVPY